ncbi:acetyl esterase/lipase [Kutzneria viridogrisea]|uniref:Acetyl esterase/lipase n=1 Tax=Kutzneria viridogrisea TaxID=47990 RepID=A0ABR6BB56_9PSEU|nr:acetyl esterase/lipase [Kutzneria viridogrisea]
MRLGTGLALAAGAAGAAVTVFARRAPWRVHPWYLAGMLPGVLGSEFALPVAGAQLAASAAATALGAGRSKLGVAGLLAATGSAAGLLDLHRQAVRAKGVLQDALDEAFGPGAAPLHVAGPTRNLRRELLAARDVPYGTEPAQVLDVWRQAGLPLDGRAPVLVQIHGGSWTGGSKNTQNLPLLSHLAANGWVCVAIDYRLGPRTRWPEIMIDVKRALAWVRANAHRHGGDPDFIAVTGGSAGGHLAALAALTANDPALQPGFEQADTSVQAAALLYGVYDLTALNEDGKPRLRGHLRRVMFDADLDEDPKPWCAASPLARLHAGAPPMFVVHGDRDEIVSVTQAREFAARARQVCAEPFGYAELPYAHHAFDMLGSTRTTAMAHAVERFLGAVRAQVRPRPT